MKRLLFTVVLTALMGGLCAQRVSVAKDEWQELPKETKKQFTINEIVGTYGDGYVVMLTKKKKSLPCYAIVDKNLNVLRYAECPYAMVEKSRYAYICGDTLHCIQLVPRQLVHSCCDLRQMVFGTPEVLSEMKMLDASKQGRFSTSLVNFDEMQVRLSPNRKYLAILSRTKEEMTGYSYCSNLMLYDNKMKQLARKDSIDAFLVRYEDRVDNMSPQRKYSVDFNVNDDGLVSLIRTYNERLGTKDKPEGSQFAIHLLSTGGFRSFELGSVTESSIMSNLHILEANNQSVMFLGCIALPMTEGNYGINGVWTFNFNISEGSIEKRSFKAFENSIRNANEVMRNVFIRQNIPSKLWRLNDGYLFRIIKSTKQQDCPNCPIEYNVISKKIGIDKNGVITNASELSGKSSRTGLFEFMYSRVIDNKLYYFYENRDEIMVEDYNCHVDTQNIQFAPFADGFPTKKDVYHTLFYENVMLMLDNKGRFCFGTIDYNAE